ncbi:hypothetical protein D9M68_521500 [compost metagenome]
MVARQERGPHAKAHRALERALRAHAGQGVGIEQAVCADSFGRVAQASLFQRTGAFLGPRRRLRQQPRGNILLFAFRQAARHRQRRRGHDAAPPRGFLDEFQGIGISKRGRLRRQRAQPRTIPGDQPVAPQHRKAAAIRGHCRADLVDPPDGGFHVAACLQQREHRVGRFHRHRVVRRRNAEQLLPVAQGFVHVAQLTGGHRRDPHDFGGFLFIAQQARRKRVRHVMAPQLELIAHQDLLGLTAGCQRAIRIAQQRKRSFVIAQLFLDLREQQHVVGQPGIAAQHVAHAPRRFAQVTRIPGLFNAVGAFVGAQLGHSGLRRGRAHSGTHEILEPVGAQALRKGRRVVGQVEPAIFHRIGLTDLVHQRRRVVARHADALRARGHGGDQLLALFDRRIVRGEGVDVRDEHHLVPAEQVDEQAHFLLDLFVRQVALDDTGEQRAVIRGETIEDRVLLQQRAPLGKPFSAGQGPEHPGTRAIGEKFTEVAHQIVGLDGIAVDGQQLARRQFDHVQVGRLMRPAAGLLAVRRSEDHALDVGGDITLAEHEPGLLHRLAAGVHEAVVAPELQLDRVAAHGIAQRRMDAAGSNGSDSKSGHSGSLL